MTQPLLRGVAVGHGGWPDIAEQVAQLRRWCDRVEDHSVGVAYDVRHVLIPLNELWEILRYAGKLENDREAARWASRELLAAIEARFPPPAGEQSLREMCDNHHLELATILLRAQARFAPASEHGGPS